MLDFMAGIGESSEMKGEGNLLEDSVPEVDGNLKSSDEEDSFGKEKEQELDDEYVVSEKFDEEFEQAIGRDRKDMFVEMLNKLTIEEVVRFDPLHYIFVYDAVDCLDAVLNGQTAGSLEINVNAVPYTFYNEQLLVPILHKAARYGASKITNYLCCHHPRMVKAQVNLRIDDDVGGLKGVLPLNLALQNLWTNVDNRTFYPPYDRHPNLLNEYSQWTSEPALKEPERLMLKWIFGLCFPHCKRHTEVVRLLAPKTHEIEQEFCKFLKGRKLLELTSLLMFARDSVIPGSKGSSKIRDIVLKEIAALKIFIFRSTYDIDSDKLMMEAMNMKKMEMEAILILLEIFDRIGDKIDAYIHLQRCTRKEMLRFDLVREISWLLKEAGFDAELELLDKTYRGSVHWDKFRIFLDTSKNNRVEESDVQINGVTNNAFGDEKDNSFHTVFDQKPIFNNESKQGSMRWLVNKQKMLRALDLYGTPSTSLRLYHTYHLARGCHGFRSTMAKKGDGCDSSSRVLSDAYNHHLGSGGMVSKLQLRRQYQGFGKSAGMTRVCGWASDLKFNGGGALSANSSRRILWITNKLGRALVNVVR